MKRALAFTLIFCCCLLLLPSSTFAYTTIFYEDFENWNVNAWYTEGTVDVAGTWKKNGSYGLQLSDHGNLGHNSHIHRNPAELFDGAVIFYARFDEQNVSTAFDYSVCYADLAAIRRVWNGSHLHFRFWVTTVGDYTTNIIVQNNVWYRLAIEWTNQTTYTSVNFYVNDVIRYSANTSWLESMDEVGLFSGYARSGDGWIKTSFDDFYITDSFFAETTTPPSTKRTPKEGEASPSSVFYLPMSISKRLGISVFLGGMLLSLIAMFSVMFPIAVYGKNKLFLPMIAGFAVMGICVSLTWLSVWFLLVYALIITLLYGSKLKEYRSG